MFVEIINVSLAAEPATLNVNLNVNDEKYDVSEVEYILGIEMKDSENNPIEGTFNCTGCKEETITFIEGKASFTVTGSPVNATIEGLTSGWNYTIKSGMKPYMDYYVTDNDEYTGTLNEGNNNVQINCEVFTQDIDITARISGFPEGVEFPLSIRIKSFENLILRGKLKYEGSKTGEINFDYEEEIISLKNGEKITISSALGGLPVGIKYKIIEEDYTEDGYITTAENAEGTIKEGENIVDFTNTKKVEEPEEEEEEVIEEEPVVEEEIEEIEEAPQTGDIIIKVCTTLVISLILINGLATYITRRNK